MIAVDSQLYSNSTKTITTNNLLSILICNTTELWLIPKYAKNLKQYEARSYSKPIIRVT